MRRNEAVVSGFEGFRYLACLFTCAQTHRVPFGAVLPEEYRRPDGGLCGESWTGSGRLAFLITFPEVGLACLLRAVT